MTASAHPMNTVHLSAALVRQWERFVTIERNCEVVEDHIEHACVYLSGIEFSVPSDAELAGIELANAMARIVGARIGAQRSRERMIARLSNPEDAHD